MKKIKWVLILVLLQSTMAFAEPYEIVYKQIDTIGLKLRIYPAEQNGENQPRPAIIFYFGGGWLSGDLNQFAPHAAHFASRGMVAVLAEYRVLGRHKTDPFTALSDAKSAMRYLRSHARELNIAPDSIVASGGSAGGHLAAATACVEGFDDPGDDLSVSCTPNALVLFNPVLDNSPEGYGYDRIKKHFPAFSPMHNVRAGLPPTVIFLGDQDNLIPVEVMKKYKKSMEANRNICELYIYPGGVHGFFNYKKPGSIPYYQATLNQADDFLTRLGYLKNRTTENK